VNKVYYLSDLLLEDLVGGGELNDYELCKMISNKGIKLTRMRTNEINKENLNKDSLYIISNFIGLKQEFKSFLIENCKYIIYEHDHKYLRSRNPAIYKDYKAPVDQIINKNLDDNIWHINRVVNVSKSQKIKHPITGDAHPCPFPEELITRIVKMSSDENDIVLDIFSGSGTVFKVSDILNRKWIGIEKEMEYCEISDYRFSCHKGETF